MQKKYLPYSKPLNDLVRSGFAPSNDVNVFIGLNAWKKGERFSVSFPERTLALPAWDDPGKYHWFVNDCSILIFDTGYAENDYTNDLAYCLYDNGAKIVRLITPDLDLVIFDK